MPQRQLAVLLFDDVELLDFAGPLEVFSVANRWTDSPTFDLATVAERPGPIRAASGLQVLPDVLLEDCRSPSIVLVPGGIGTRRLIDNSAVIDWIKRTAETAELMLSVCTGSLLFAKAGLLDGLETTTHHTAFDLLRQLAPAASVREDLRYVDNGAIVTSAGISAGIDMSLHIVQRLLGAAIAEKTADQMEYVWMPR